MWLVQYPPTPDRSGTGLWTQVSRLPQSWETYNSLTAVRLQGFAFAVFMSWISRARVLCDSLPLRAAKQTCAGSFWTYLRISRILRKICFLHCIGNAVGKLLECFSKIVYRFENCLGFVIASVVCLFVSSHFSKFNKHFAEEQNNWSHICGFPDLFYMCMQYSVTQNMFEPSASNHLRCCGQDQSRAQVSTHSLRPHHSPSLWPQCLGARFWPQWRIWRHHGPRPKAAVTGSHRGLKTQSGVWQVGAFVTEGSNSHCRKPQVAISHLPSPCHLANPVAHKGLPPNSMSLGPTCKAGEDCIISSPSLSGTFRTFPFLSCEAHKPTIRKKGTEDSVDFLFVPNPSLVFLHRDHLSLFTLDVLLSRMLKFMRQFQNKASFPSHPTSSQQFVPNKAG